MVVCLCICGVDVGRGWSSCECGGQRSASSIFISSSLMCYLRKSLPPILLLTDSARLSGERAPGMHLPLLHHNWDSSHKLLCWTFYRSARGPNSGLHTYTTTTEPSPQLHGTILKVVGTTAGTESLAGVPLKGIYSSPSFWPWVWACWWSAVKIHMLPSLIRLPPQMLPLNHALPARGTEIPQLTWASKQLPTGAVKRCKCTFQRWAGGHRPPMGNRLADPQT